MDLHNVGLSSFYRVKDYVSAASAIGQNYCEYGQGREEERADEELCRPRDDGQVLHHQREWDRDQTATPLTSPSLLRPLTSSPPSGP